MGPYQLVRSRVIHKFYLIIEWIFTPSYPYLWVNFLGVITLSDFYLQLVGAHLDLSIYLFFFWLHIFWGVVPPSGWLCAPGCNSQCVRAVCFWKIFSGRFGIQSLVENGKQHQEFLGHPGRFFSMEPKIHPIEKENHLPNLYFLGSILIFEGVILWSFSRCQDHFEDLSESTM